MLRPLKSLCRCGGEATEAGGGERRRHAEIRAAGIAVDVPHAFIDGLVAAPRRELPHTGTHRRRVEAAAVETAAAFETAAAAVETAAAFSGVHARSGFARARTSINLWKSLSPVSARARPRKVAPPHAVPPTRVKLSALSTRMTLTPDPMLTRMNGKSGLGQATLTSWPLFSSTVKSSPEGGWCSARKSKPLSAACSSLKGTSSTCNVSRNMSLNRRPPPPAATILRKLFASVSGQTMRSRTDLHVASSRCVGVATKCNVPAPEKNDDFMENESSGCLLASLPKLTFSKELLPVLSVRNTSFASVPPMSRPMRDWNA